MPPRTLVSCSFAGVTFVNVSMGVGGAIVSRTGKAPAFPL